MPKKLPVNNPDIPETWPKWTDVLGQTYHPGDFIAYACINGKSPQMVFAKVLSIRRLDSQRNEIISNKYSYNRETKTSEHTVTLSCKVKVQPLLDARNFYRSSDPKAVTLSIPENIIKVMPRPEWTDIYHIEELQKMRDELNAI